MEISTDLVVSIFRSDDTSTSQMDHPFAVLSSEQIEARLELATRENILEESYDIAHSDSDGPGIPTELITLLYLFLLNKDSLYAIKTSQADLPSRSKLSTELVGHVLVHIFEKRMKEFATSIDEDEQLLTLGNLPSRKNMAITVRLGEKKVLREAIKEAEMFKGDNRRMRDLRGLQEPPTKDGNGKRKMEEGSNTKKKSRLR